MAEILHQLIGSFSHYLQGFIHPRWCKISAINSISLCLDVGVFFPQEAPPRCPSERWQSQRPRSPTDAPYEEFGTPSKLKEFSGHPKTPNFHPRNPQLSPQKPSTFTPKTTNFHPRNPQLSPQKPPTFIPETLNFHPRNPQLSPQKPSTFTPKKPQLSSQKPSTFTPETLNFHPQTNVIDAKSLSNWCRGRPKCVAFLSPNFQGLEGQQSLGPPSNN